MSIETIKKALKKVYIGEWYISGVKTNGLSVVHNAADSSMFGITAETFEAEYICAANPFAVTDLLSEIDRLQRENGALKEENSSLLDENSDLRNEPWPEWAKAVLKVIRSHTGYDGYDDALEGVDMPLELEEHLSELQSENDRLQSRAEAAGSEVKRLQAEIDRKSSMPGDHRYWEGRYRDEAAENEKLRGVVERAQSIVSTSTYPNWHDTARTALASTGGEHHAE